MSETPLTSKAESTPTAEAPAPKAPFPIWFLFCMVIAAVIVDAAIMFTLDLFPPLPATLEILVNGTALGLILFPLVYFAVFRRLRAQLEEALCAGEALRAERDQSKRLIDSTPAIVCGIQPDGTTAFINPAGERITGYRADEIVGKNWWTTFYPNKEHEQVEQLFCDFETGDVCNHEMTLTTKDGAKRTIFWNSINLFDEAGEIIEIVGFGNDVTETKLSQETVAELAKFPNENPNPVIRISNEGALIYANQPGVALLSQGGEAAPAEIPGEWGDIVGEVMLTGLNKVVEMECAERFFALTFAPISGLGYVNVYGMDVTERKRLEEELRRLSHLDSLTEIPNRRMFNEILEREWQRGKRNKTPIALMMIDVDAFKKYNDNYGHANGDKCLKRVAVTLTGALRRPTDFIARYGGEEFAAVLSDTSVPGAKRLAETMCEQVAAMKIPHAHAAHANHVTISLGLATTTPSDASTPGQLVESADSALYQAKELGRNQAFVHQPGLAAKAAKAPPPR